MEKSSQIAWKIVPLRHYFPLKVVPLIEVLLYQLSMLLARLRVIFSFTSQVLISLLVIRVLVSVGTESAGEPVKERSMEFW
jgi:hypothetical protein